MNQIFKNYLKLLNLLCFTLLHLTSTAYTECSTKLSNYQIEHMNLTQEERSNINVDQAINGIINIPVIPHILKPDSTSQNNSYITPEELNIVFQHLNDAFSEAGFVFNACSPNYITYTKPIRYSIHPTSNEFFIANETAQPRALNIYFTPDAVRGSGESVCGWASFPGEYYQSGKNWIVIRNDCAINGSTIIHEVGHYFNLYHTHQNENARLGITEQELADTSNCGDGVGDELCDTPAEPYRGGNGINGIVNEECLILCEYKDINDNLYIPGLDNQQNNSIDGTNYNYMSYAPYECRNHFTEEQINRMKVSYLIDRNYLSTICPDFIPNQNECDAAKDLKVLYKLYASINGPTPETWEGVTFSDEGCVTHIDLDGSNLSEENKLTGSLPVEIEDLWHLETLILSNNNICGTIPANLGNLKKLQWLDLSGNQITGSIPPEFENLTDLSYLNLSDNSMCGYIPYQLSDLPNLTHLLLADNPFTGCLHPSVQNLCTQKVTDNFCNNLNTCTNCNEDDWLAIKHIYNNMDGINSPKMSDYIHGYFNSNLNSPPQDCDLSSIKFLHLNDYGRVKAIQLGSYELSGSIPSTISMLSDLKTLVLDNNLITGKVPESLSELNNLEAVNLWENPIDTCLPVSLTKLCGQAGIGMFDNWSFDFYNNFCDGKGGYCEPVDDYVMPGDFNNDKKVTNTDFLYWKTANGTSNGIVREDANTTWLPQFCNDWNGTSLKGVNHKHQDANGDGKIDEADLQVFYLNLGKGTENGELFNANLPNTSNANVNLELTGDGQNGFFVKINDVENVQMLVFTIGLSNQSYNNVAFDYAGITNKPILEDIQWIDEANHIEVTLEWHPDFPPPTNEDPFGRINVKVDDETGGSNAFLRVDNINILSNNAITVADGLDYAFDNTETDNVFCVNDQVIQGPRDISDTYNAANSIVSPPQDAQGNYGETYINGCTNITFNAGNFIVLNPGFKNQHGTVFCAQIKPCITNKMNNPFIEQSELSIYPNPTKNQATIAFDLAKPGAVSLNITDITGKQITNLINNITKEKGKHNIAYNTGNLPTGVYYCTLKHHETISTQKLIVVK